MKDYNNLVDALKDLNARGYTNDFNLKPHCLECKTVVTFAAAGYGNIVPISEVARLVVRLEISSNRTK